MLCRASQNKKLNRVFARQICILLCNELKIRKMTTRQLNALVVDDVATNRRLASMLLKKLGWLVAEAESGQNALEYLATNGVDVLLLDLNMPGMTGEEVCKQIRNNEKLKHLRVVAYTAHVLPDEKLKMIEAGFDGLLVKPISKATLTEALNEVMVMGDKILDH